MCARFCKLYRRSGGGKDNRPSDQAECLNFSRSTLLLIVNVNLLCTELTSFVYYLVVKLEILEKVYSICNIFFLNVKYCTDNLRINDKIIGFLEVEGE